MTHVELGSTLYTPAVSKHLIPIGNGIKFPHLTSVVFCLEDAIKNNQLHEAMQNIQEFLNSFQPSQIKVFLRPRDIQNLQDLLLLENIDKIDGFALAKFGTLNMKEYLNIFQKEKQKFYLMPVLESRDMFEIEKLKIIRDYLLKLNGINILTLRVGGEDMFNYLGIKKRCDESIHDFHISKKVFSEVLSVFKPYGFNVTAPVYNCLENKDFFLKELQRDIKEGFFGKTVIHPDQVKICNEVYKVTSQEYDEAKQILDKNNEAIFRFGNKMIEPAAHTTWAKNIVARKEVFGIKLECNQSV